MLPGVEDKKEFEEWEKINDLLIEKIKKKIDPIDILFYEKPVQQQVRYNHLLAS